MQPKKILIVDDSKVAAMTQQIILRSLKQCEVITAEDGIKSIRWWMTVSDNPRASEGADLLVQYRSI
jgi:CheY-like chemotaxis protein